MPQETAEMGYVEGSAKTPDRPSDATRSPRGSLSFRFEADRDRGGDGLWSVSPTPRPLSRRADRGVVPLVTVSSSHFRLVDLTEGVYAAIATDSGHGLCNSGIVDLGDGTLVFDSMLTPQAGADLRRAAEIVTGHPVTYLVNSHYHGDHVRGNISFPSVRIVSTRKVRELIEEKAVEMLESDRAEVVPELEALRSGRKVVPERDRTIFEGWFEGILATPKGTAIPSPDLLVEDTLLLRGPRRTVEVRTFGGGHSPSDVFAHLPDEKVDFLGDLLATGFHPSVTDGVAEEWVRILDQVRALGARQILPGHGPVGGQTEIRQLQEYLRTLLKLARAARRSSLSREAIRATSVPSAFAAWTFPSFFGDNLLSVHDRLSTERTQAPEVDDDRPRSSDRP